MENKCEIFMGDFEYLRALKIGGLYELSISSKMYYYGFELDLCSILQMVSRYIKKANFIIRYSAEEIKFDGILNEEMQSFW